MKNIWRDYWKGQTYNASALTVSIPTTRNLLEMYRHPYLHGWYGAGRFSSEQLTDA